MRVSFLYRQEDDDEKKNDEKKKTKKKGQTTKQFPFSPVDPRKRETERERTD